MSTDTLARMRNDFRKAFQNYLAEGDRMAALLRAGADEGSEDRAAAIRHQQAVLNEALREYEAARQHYVEAVMGQLAGLSAMGLKLQ